MVPIKSLLEELLSPVVAVISSPEAESIVQTADGLTIAELCRPFGHFLNLNAGVGGASVHAAARPQPITPIHSACAYRGGHFIPRAPAKATLFRCRHHAPPGTHPRRTASAANPAHRCQHIRNCTRHRPPTAPCTRCCTNTPSTQCHDTTPFPLLRPSCVADALVPILPL